LARIELGRSYLALGKLQEAYLISIEILAAKYPKALTPEIETGAYLIRAHSLLGSNKNDRAHETLDEARKALEKKKELPKEAPKAPETTPAATTAAPAVTPPAQTSGTTTPPAPIGFEEAIAQLDPWSLPTEPMLRAELEWLALKMKSRDCMKIEAGGLLTENQVFDLAERRGSCLLEAAFILRRAFELDPLDSPEDEQESMEKVVEEFLNGFTLYTKSCMNPPNPPGKRSRVQLKRYKAELVDRLQGKCEEKRKLAGSFVDGWKTSLSPNRAKLLGSLKHSLETLPRSLDYRGNLKSDAAR
jgi:tetratricopeptide (TPR) repeat protein